jgi:hypothetical protein
MSAILMLSIKNLELLNEGAGVLPRGRHRALKKNVAFSVSITSYLRFPLVRQLLTPIPARIGVGKLKCFLPGFSKLVVLNTTLKGCQNGGR